ncbi:ATP-binding protein [Gracilinema caldarium]|uniref:Uncharacterized protein n=1 Tax=Gracilinema caldarium (strain ATCC 51460 / DSM 7334 / H1) TaxID=744872 RepID=F8EX56_GRAC1|nr:ATP-binding protein [Gracilinema caldarium]AEJ18799.1 protein of unknown function DUF815 [Gracilinema caldarium DSM 7334]
MIRTEQLSQWLLSLDSLTFFRGIHQHRLIQKLQQLCESLIPLLEKHDHGTKTVEPLSLAQKRSLVQIWAELLETLVSITKVIHLTSYQNLDLYTILADLVLQDENVLTLALERHPVQQLSLELATLAQADLDRLYDLAGLSLKDLTDTVAFFAGPALTSPQNLFITHNDSREPHRVLPAHTPWSSRITELGDFIRTHGAGILGQHHAFIWKQWKQSSHKGPSQYSLYPVLHEDPIALDDLSGYEEQRSVVIENTRRFVEGKSANNMLLYGDRGTGKSATVKAVCRAFADRGLKLIEVRKRDLMHFEEIAETLSGRGLTFVLFIDDLSFEATDDTFTGLKALLEGGLERRPANVVIYATSNRRHLVKEHFADRPTAAQAAEALTTGDVRAFDTMQEQLSLADRFGVTVVFTAPNQEEYLAIAEAIAERRGLLTTESDRERFRQNALRWEKWFNGRSPRTAQQYVDWLAGGELFPWE